MLSILIPTIPSREGKFWYLKKELEKQIKYCTATHPTLGTVEVLIDDAPPFLEGGPSIGDKRQSLVKKASQKYLCFLDDDDYISPDYVETLLRLCNEDKDVCTFRNISKFDSYWAIIDMSKKYLANDESSPEYIVRRLPWHICPVRSSFAKVISFDSSNYGEDWRWFGQVLKMCHTEAKTDKVIHQYNHSVKTSEADKAHEKSGS